MGEEARVDLSHFTPRRATRRQEAQALRRLEKERASFRGVAPEGIAALFRMTMNSSAFTDRRIRRARAISSPRPRMRAADVFCRRTWRA